jgi:hypothetical protein
MAFAILTVLAKLDAKIPRQQTESAPAATKAKETKAEETGDDAPPVPQ